MLYSQWEHVHLAPGPWSTDSVGPDLFKPAIFMKQMCYKYGGLLKISLFWF